MQKKLIESYEEIPLIKMFEKTLRYNIFKKLLLSVPIALTYIPIQSQNSEKW